MKRITSFLLAATMGMVGSGSALATTGSITTTTILPGHSCYFINEKSVAVTGQVSYWTDIEVPSSVGSGKWGLVCPLPIIREATYKTVWIHGSTDQNCYNGPCPWADIAPSGCDILYGDGRGEVPSPTANPYKYITGTKSQPSWTAGYYRMVQWSSFPDDFAAGPYINGGRWDQNAAVIYCPKVKSTARVYHVGVQYTVPVTITP